MKEINVVWLKRDLRLNDHACLAAAEASELPYLIMYCFLHFLLSVFGRVFGVDDRCPAPDPQCCCPGTPSPW